MKRNSGSAVWLVALLLIICVSAFAKPGRSSTNDIPYSTFKQNWESDKIESIIIQEDKMLIEGKTKDGKAFSTYSSSEMMVSLMEEHPNDSVVITFKAPSNSGVWLSVIPMIILIVILLVFMFMITQQSQNSGSGRNVMNFGKSRAKRALPNSQKVTFKDVAGADEEKAELEEIVDFLKLALLVQEKHY